MRRITLLTLSLLSVFVLLSLPTSPVLSTTVVRMNLEELAASSPAIVHGQVISVRSRWNDDRSMIITEARIRVLGSIKGEPGSEVMVIQPGGILGKLKVEIPGVGLMLPDDEVVLFLAPGGGGNLYVNGLTQGRFDVVLDPRTGIKTVRGLTSSQIQTLRHGEPGPGAEVGATPGNVALDEFLDGVQKIVRDLPEDGGGGR